MKKYGWMGGVVLSLGLLSATAYADNPRVGDRLPPSQYPFETIFCDMATNCTNVLGPGRVVYGFSVNTDVAGGECALFDQTTLPTDAQLRAGRVLIDEKRVSLDEDTQDSTWPSPYKIQNGLSVGCEDAFATIFVDPD